MNNKKDFFFKDNTLSIKNKHIIKYIENIYISSNNNISQQQNKNILNFLNKIYIEESNNKKENNSIKEKNLIEKINNTYKIYLNNLANLNIDDFYNSINQTEKTVFQIDKIDLYLFHKIYYDFIVEYLNNFMGIKISSLRKENKSVNKKIPIIFFKQKINPSIKKYFINWFLKSKLLNRYNVLIKNKYNYFDEKLEYNYSESFKYIVDYLKSPFDEDKIDYIYKNSIKSLKSIENREILFLNIKNKQIFKLLIQEIMLDYIKNNILLENFIFNINKKNMKKYLDKNYITYKLYELIEEEIYNNTNTIVEFKTMKQEYYDYIKPIIINNIIEFYKDYELLYKIEYNNIGYRNLNNNKELINLFKEQIKKYYNYIIDKRIKLNNIDEIDDLDFLVKKYKTIIKNIKANKKSTLFITEEEIYIYKFSEFYIKNEINKDLPIIQKNKSEKMKNEEFNIVLN